MDQLTAFNSETKSKLFNNKRLADTSLMKRKWLKRSLPMMSILVIIGRIYRYHLKCDYPNNERLFACILLHFWNLHLILSISNETEPHSLSISEIIDLRDYLLHVVIRVKPVHQFYIT